MNKADNLSAQLMDAAAVEINKLQEELIALGHTPETAVICERTYYDEEKKSIVFECWPAFKKVG